MLDKNKIPADLYGQEDKKDPIVYCVIKFQKMFWLITEYNAEEKEAFGFAQIHEGCGELGYIYIPELEEVLKKYFGWSITYVEKPLSQVKKELQ